MIPLNLDKGGNRKTNCHIDIGMMGRSALVTGEVKRRSACLEKTEEESGALPTFQYTHCSYRYYTVSFTARKILTASLHIQVNGVGVLGNFAVQYVFTHNVHAQIAR